MSFKPSRFYEFTVAANAAYVLTVAGEYFKVMGVDAPINVKGDWGELRGLVVGQGLESSPFSRLLITNESAAPNNVRLFIGDRNFIDGMVGVVKVSEVTAPVKVEAFRSVPLTLTQAAETVTNASAQLLAANAARQYLMIQNKSASGDVFLKFGAGPATSAGGVRLVAGGVLELDSAVTTQAIFAIGSIASNPDIVILEGV